MQILLLKCLKPKFLLRLLLGTSCLFVGLVLLLSIVANLFAAVPNNKLTQIQAETIEAYPPSEDNVSARKIQRLAAKLGLKPFMETQEEKSLFLPTKTDEESFTKIQQQLTTYIKSQISKSSDRIDAPPTELKAYFDRQANNITAIRTYLLQNEPPKWGLYDGKEVAKNPFTFSLPSFLDLINLNRILIYDALVKNNLGQAQLALDNLEAVTKLNQNLYDRPDLISQFVAMINFNQQAGVLRKIDGINPGWEKKLLTPDARQSLLKSTEFETKLMTIGMRDLPLIFLISDNQYSLNSLLMQVDKILLRPYRIFLAADLIDKQQKIIDALPKQDICTLNFDEFVVANKLTPAKWNVLTFSNFSKPLIEDPLLRVGKRDIAWELTQKIQQIKKSTQKNGQPPQNISGIELSKVCPSLRWKYQTNTDGSVSISLDNPPQWLKINQGDLPIKYTFKLEKEIQ